VNEDENGITPANVTAMTVEPLDDGWFVTVEQGNGDSVQTLRLTKMERDQLACLLEMSSNTPYPVSCEFVDVLRSTATEARMDHCPGCAHRYGTGCGCACCADSQVLT
jgi:hypothetical protein